MTLYRSKLVFFMFLIGLVFLGVFFINPISAQAGLGVSPSVIEINDILAGAQATKKFVLSRSDPFMADRVKIVIDGPAASSIEGESEIILPRGSQQVEYTFTIETAGLLKNKDYEAVILFSFIKEGDEAELLAAAFPSISVAVHFSVTDEIQEEFMIKQVIIKSSEEMQPLGFSYFLINSGNVGARPSKIEIAITDQTNPENIYRETILGDTLASVAAFSEKNVNLLTQAKLKNGRYWVDFTFYDGDEVVFTRTGYALQIFPMDKNNGIAIWQLFIFSAVFVLVIVLSAYLIWLIKTRLRK